jgi:hypothetical protein
MTFPRLKRVLALLVLSSVSLSAQQAKPAPVAGTVYLTPTCGCCSKWVDHMTAAGFKMSKEMTPDMDLVAAHKRVPQDLRSCHTTVIGDYLIAGHVPADLVRKMLKEQPKIAGLSAPGMPAGSPGMDAPNAPPYAIVAFKADGTRYEYARR